jgi:repressor LexA
LSYIIKFIDDHGYEPSYQQIARHIGVKSKGGIAKHIEALERQGLLLRNHDNGGFKLEINPQSTVSDLICQIEWLDNPKFTNKTPSELERLYIPKSMLGILSPLNVRALVIRDNALLNKHICEDDIALIEIKSFARDGQLVAALINNNEILLRHFHRVGPAIDLVPANEKYETISCPADKITLLGIFRGLLRPLF